ncbi:cadherin-related family member 5 isoform X2 [Pleurodeles waltl]|uniref:cadherin-related family member 5 isoform X2 n=1 Tax=Pleurodeles waltl TaxID=8319 RepID=UPI0037094BC0
MAASLGSALVPLCLLLSTYLGIALAQGNQVCSASSGRIEENKPAGSVVTTIVAAADVTVTIDQGPGSDPYSHFFKINGSNLVLNNSLDYEEVNVIVLTLLCQKNGITVNELTVTVEVLNLNDERPVFERDFVAWQVPEDTKVGTSLGSLTARDADLDLIYYDLVATSSDGSSQFRLAGVNSPTIELSGALDYDVFTHAQFLLYARDTLETNVTPSHTATATINITILDVDNKNPWFQPCRFIDANKKICHSDGYHVNVTRSENVTGALVLRPGPLYAIDGDRGINDAIRYEVISGNEENIFVLGNETGNITMQKPASVPGTIVLEVLASEVNNSLRYAVTSVQIQVVERNKHPPRFQSTAYRGTMPAYSLPGSLVMEFNSPSRPLKIVAEDEDFDDKKNPAISYSIENSTDFLVSQDGYIQSSAQLNTSGTTVILAAAVDKTSGEKATTVVVVEISPVAGAETTTTALTTVTSTPGGGTSTLLPPILTSSALPGTVTRTTVKTLETTTRSSHTGSSTTGITNRPSGTAHTLSQTTTVSTTTISGTPGKPATGNSSVTTSRVTPPVPSLFPTRSTSSAIPAGSTTSKQTITANKPTASGTTRITAPPSVGPPGSQTTKPPHTGTVVTTSKTTRITLSPSNGPPDSKTTTTARPGTGSTTRSLTTITVPISFTPPGLGTTKPSTPRTGPTPSGTTKFVTTHAGESPGSGTVKPTLPGIPVVISPLQYSAADMAAVGASLAAVLLICLAVLGFLIHKQYGYKFAKIPAMDINFPSTASGDSNEGNKKLIDNECAESTNSAPNEADIEGGTLNLNFRASETTTDSLPRESSALRVTEAAFPSAFFAVDQLEEDVDKEVRSILTKERRVNDESYKAVWFKGDIEPDEVVTIHENEQDVEGEEDELSDEVGEEEEEEDESDDGEDQQGGGYNHEPTVAFSTNNESINTIL